MFSLSLLSLYFFYSNSPERQSVFTFKKLCIQSFSRGEVGRFSQNEGAGMDEPQEVTKG